MEEPARRCGQSLSSTLNEYGVVAELRALRFERLLPGPIERVWAYLTESEMRAKWLSRCDHISDGLRGMR